MLLKVIPASVTSLDITYPQSCSIDNQACMYLPRALVAMRLRISGLINSQEPLRLVLDANMRRLTLQAWGGHVVLHGYRDAYKYMKVVYVEAASIEAVHWDFPHSRVPDAWQVSTRVPDETEIYGGTGGQPVQVTHFRARPPRVSGYEGPDVPEARTCCHWPCACGACDICRKADFWQVPLGSG